MHIDGGRCSTSDIYYFQNLFSSKTQWLGKKKNLSGKTWAPI